MAIATVTGENGILSKAETAKEKHIIEQYKEQIKIIKAETRLKYNEIITLDRLKNELDDEKQKSWVNNTQIITDNGIEKIKLITNDQYIFYITDETIEYKENENIITAQMVSFTPEDNSWNVENVKEALDYLFNN